MWVLMRGYAVAPSLRIDQTEERVVRSNGKEDAIGAARTSHREPICSGGYLQAVGSCLKRPTGMIRGPGQIEQAASDGDGDICRIRCRGRHDAQSSVDCQLG